jgi:fermentation-respiration switch protein FrsA (DUF1100 family)
VAIKLVVFLVIAIVAVVILVRLLEPSMAFFPLRGEDATPSAAGLPFEAIDLRTTDGETLRAWWMPHHQPRAAVLYLHGNGGNLAMWMPVLAAIQQRGFSILAVDYRGYGLSTGQPSEQGLYRDAESAMAQLVERAGPGLPIVFWGRSLGAVVAAYAASLRQPDGLILESGFPNARALLAGSPLWVLSFVASYRFPADRWLDAVRCPTLVLHGTADSVIPFRLGQRLHDAVRGPKQFVAIEGGDHNDAVPATPDIYWKAVTGFADSLRRRS